MKMFYKSANGPPPPLNCGPRRGRLLMAGFAAFGTATEGSFF